MKLDYELQIASVLAAQEYNHNLSLLMEEVKKTGTVRVRSVEVLCWNWPREVNGEWIESEKPNSDGSFDKMGLNNSDVCGHYKFYWWQRRNWSTLWKMIKVWAEDLKDIVFDDLMFLVTKGKKKLGLKRLSLVLSSLRTFGLKLRPFKVEQSRWFWVVDSLSSDINEVLYDHAEDLLAQAKGFEDSIDMFTKLRSEKHRIIPHELIVKKAAELGEAMTHEDKIKLVEDRLGLMKVSDEMWVNAKDHTVITYDDSKLPFALRDGWTYDQIATVITIWFKTIYNMDIKYEIVKDEE